jgi:uncharacterized protein (DUF427 family)
MKPAPEPIAPGQESVWSYPRPAIAERTDAHVRIEHAGKVLVDTNASVRTLETSHPPSYYIPLQGIAPGILSRAPGTSFCEWKGGAVYWNVVLRDIVLPGVGWSYPAPSRPFGDLRDHVAFYAERFDLCSVNGERARPQPGGFYGGWITSKVVGPFKGGSGTRGW